MAQREGFSDPQRQCVVGIKPVDVVDKLRSGSHLLKREDAPSMARDQGYISSVAWSPMLNMWLGLALLANGRARHGEIVKVYDGLRGIQMYAEICDPVHFDKEHKNLHV
jgi:methylglutamate dehydrogenase subunit C